MQWRFVEAPNLMPWLTFTENFNWSPAEFRGAVSIFFKAPNTYLVVREANEAALSAGAARKATKQEAEDARRRRP